jgi:hypothetical protein
MGTDDHTLMQNSRDRLCDLWDAEGLGDSDGLFASVLSKVPPKTGLPNGPYGVLLSKLVINQSLYKSFLAMVLGGALVKSAAEAVGVPAKHVQHWLSYGNKHFNEGKDSWYARFYYDILRAKGMARAGAQARVKMMKPLQWLGNDADSRGWSEQPAASAPQLEAFLEPVAELDDGGDSVFDPSMIREAFMKLHQMGSLPSPDVLVAEALKQEGIYLDDQGKPSEAS